MASRAAVQELVRAGADYDEIAERLGIRPGLAYLLATGLPADGSDSPTPNTHERTGFMADSQQLSNPQPAENPTSKASVLDWIKQRSAGDAQMRSAAAARTPGPAAEQEGAEPADAIDLLGRDHTRVDSMLKQLSTLKGVTKGGSPAVQDARKTLTDLITEVLRPHSEVEATHLWPLVRERLDDGEQLADKAAQGRQRTSEVLDRLGELTGHEEEFDDLVEELTALSRHHSHLAATAFLGLRSAVSREDLLELGPVVDAGRAPRPRIGDPDGQQDEHQQGNDGEDD